MCVFGAGLDGFGFLSEPELNVFIVAALSRPVMGPRKKVERPVLRSTTLLVRPERGPIVPPFIRRGRES